MVQLPEQMITWKGSKKAEDKLKAKGHMVYNPAAVNNCMPEGTTYEEYMDVSFLLLSMADAIYMLNEWENSKGANREYGYALGRGYAVLTEELKKSYRKCRSAKGLVRRREDAGIRENSGRDRG